MVAPSGEYAESRPFKIFISLLDKWEIGAPLTESLVFDSFKAIKRLIETADDGEDVGFYQRGDSSNPLSIETSFRSLDRFQAECNATFWPTLPPSPQVEHVVKYGGWNMTPSNVLFTNGECKLPTCLLR